MQRGRHQKKAVFPILSSWYTVAVVRVLTGNPHLTADLVGRPGLLRPATLCMLLIGPDTGVRRIIQMLLDKWVHRFHRSEEHTSELQSRFDLVCRLLLEKNKL